MLVTQISQYGNQYSFNASNRATEMTLDKLTLGLVAPWPKGWSIYRDLSCEAIGRRSASLQHRELLCGISDSEVKAAARS